MICVGQADVAVVIHELPARNELEVLLVLVRVDGHRHAQFTEPLEDRLGPGCPDGIAGERIRPDNDAVIGGLRPGKEDRLGDA